MDGLNSIGLTCFEPRGAFYAFPSIAVTGMSDEEFSERLLMEEKVACVPGSAFGACGAGHVRCSYATAYDQIEAGAGADGALCPTARIEHGRIGQTAERGSLA